MYYCYYYDIHPADETVHNQVYYYFYSTTTTTSVLPMRRPTGFHTPRRGPARVQPVPKRAEERFTVAMRYFPEPKFLVHTR